MSKEKKSPEMRAAVLEGGEMKQEIKPCPFCGCNDLAKKIGYFSSIHCNGCDAIGPMTKNKDEHIEKWNTRHTPCQPIQTLKKEHVRVLTYNGVRIGRLVDANGLVIPVWEVELSIVKKIRKDTMPHRCVSLTAATYIDGGESSL